MKKLITFASKCQTHFSTIKPVYDQIKKDGKYDVNVVLGKETKWDSSDLYIVSSYDYNWLKIAPKSFLIMHGMGQEQITLTKAFYKVLLCGTHFYNKYPNQILVGWPKSDILFKAIRNPFKLPYEKTVLFNGAYKHEKILWDIYLPVLIKLSKKHKFNLIIKVRDDVTYQHEIKEQRLSDITKKNNHIKVANTELNNWSLFPFINVSFSGLSSTIREFYAVKKPSFFLEGKFPCFFNESFKVNSCNIEVVLLDAFVNPNKYVVDEETVTKFFYKLDGHVVDRIVKLIDDYFESGIR